LIVSLEITEQTKRTIAEHTKLAEQFDEANAKALHSAAVAGASDITRQLMLGELGLTMQNPASGLAASVDGWMIDTEAPLAAVGVPGNAPAAAYASIHETGGTIVPRSAKALAVPISEEAKQCTSPRDMDGLDLIPRKGRPPLLVRQLAAKGRRRSQFQLHWVLVPSVTIRPTHWLSRGAETATVVMVDGYEGCITEYVENWN